jgi:carbonic anhydrase
MATTQTPPADTTGNSNPVSTPCVCCGKASSDSTEHTNLSVGAAGYAKIGETLLVRPPPKRGSGIQELLRYNEDWSTEIRRLNPDYFKELSKQQTPQYLWIGCSDSRVPANQVVGLPPGEVFVHRNVANVVARSDLNCLSVVHYAVCCLKVEHVVVCGHYGCGGVKAALENKRLGLVDNWTLHIKDVIRRFEDLLARIDPSSKLNALCELNVIQQFSNVVESHVFQDYWADPTQPNVDVHGCCYGLVDGIIHPIVSMKRGQDLKEVVDDAVNRVEKKYCVK